MKITSLNIKSFVAMFAFLAVMAVLLSSCQRGYYGGGYGGRGYGCPGRITQQTEQQPAVVPQPVITDIDC
ncbi:MAG: hypothetical protein IPI59_13250 [Sphingobacteriales bacterium]|jgi:hypothetical protein|nr:hypothetical protein [Sphingobacteriales bacterium]MBP9140237.1 hypothetical protein [Chitinophagales bacterium]MDA0197629.1 hypothetical protein [Bacteroidota bacterium]MBK6889012.1 hypothetical protein [Sphingobacteriales bacterium]MBK7528484.1 hypothetical protein [Sphingobacteriales bacterium]